MKQAIKDFNGTVIVVSHDREFLDGLVEKVYEFGGGQVKECLGGIYDFLEKKKIQSLAELELSKSPTTLVNNSKNQKPSVAVNAPDKLKKLSYTEQREREKAIKRAEKKVSEAETEIVNIETRIAEIEEKIANGEIDNDIFSLHQSMNKKLENAMSMWEIASMECEELKNKYN